MIALHLPLFAAIAAHYQAVPEAPRIILLDEVFVGVDSNNPARSSSCSPRSTWPSCSPRTTNGAPTRN